MSEQLSDQLSDQPSGEAPQDLKSPQLSDEGSWRSLSLAWDELRRRALLGEGLTSELGSQAAPPLDELSPESWRELALSVALRRTLPPPLRAPLEGVESH